MEDFIDWVENDMWAIISDSCHAWKKGKIDLKQAKQAIVDEWVFRIPKGPVQYAGLQAINEYVDASVFEENVNLLAGVLTALVKLEKDSENIKQGVTDMKKRIIEEDFSDNVEDLYPPLYWWQNP